MKQGLIKIWNAVKGIFIGALIAHVLYDLFMPINECPAQVVIEVNNIVSGIITCVLTILAGTSIGINIHQRNKLKNT